MTKITSTGKTDPRRCRSPLRGVREALGGLGRRKIVTKRGSRRNGAGEWAVEYAGKKIHVAAPKLERLQAVGLREERDLDRSR